MSSSGYDGDYEHHELMMYGEWDSLREMLNSKGSSERFASTNFNPNFEDTNAFQDLCSMTYDVSVDISAPPLDIVARMLEIDERNLFEKVNDPSIGATPLHIACESGSEPLVKMLLTTRPDAGMRLVSEQDARGMTPLDVAWLHHIDPDYCNYAGDYFGSTKTSGRVIASLAKFSGLNGSLNCERAKDIWGKTVHMLFAVATAEADIATPTSWNVVQAIASTKFRCPNIAMWVALKVHPEQVRWQDRNGNFALHMASVCRNHYRYPLHPSGHDRNDLVSIMDEWDDGEEEKGQTRAIIDEAQASPISMLVEVYPEAASIPNNEGRYPIHLAAESGANWADEVEHLLSAAPRTIDKRDPKTMLLPFMLAAVEVKEDEPADLVYKLLRANPANVTVEIQNLKRKAQAMDA